jgi:SAM-dependent methyltransferase
MTNYSNFATYYDDIMGDRKSDAENIDKLIRKYSPKAKKILETGCGTGAVIGYLNKKGYEVSGFDASDEMLALAKKRLPAVKLSRQDLTSFNFEDKFDAVICVFDTVNHLLDINSWLMFFKNSYNHLNNGGVLLFDMNTKGKLEQLSKSSPLVKKGASTSMSITVTKQENDVYNWHIEIQPNNPLLSIVSENIKEVSFPIDKITDDLRKNYSEVKIIGQDDKVTLEKRDRVFFVCIK